MRPRLCCRAAIVCALVVPLLIGAASAATARKTRVHVVVDTIADSMTTVQIPVPAGVRPRRISGTLAVEEELGGRVSFEVNGRERSSVKARQGRTVEVPVRPRDVRAGTILLGIRYDVTPSAANCLPGEPIAVALRGPVLTYQGSETTVTDIADFFGPAVSQVHVVVPATATDELLTAGLSVVAGLSTVYPDSTPVLMTTDDELLPQDRAGQRVVRIRPGDEGVVASARRRDGLQTLDLVGSGQPLLDAARALSAQVRITADSTATRGIAEVPASRDVDTERSLTELGASEILLTGAARSTYLDFPQDAFGGPVESLELDLVGTHSSLPFGTTVQLNTYLNGTLLDSQILDRDSDLAIEAEVPATQLEASNRLQLTLSTLPDEGECGSDTNPLPLEVYVDGAGSTIQATPGPGALTGFETLPQSFGGALPVGIRGTGPARVQAALDASYLVSALQKAGATPLEVSVADADEFLDQQQSGLLVGADYDDSVALQAPLRLAGERLGDLPGASMQVSADQAFAALQAVALDDRRVLVLGGWSPGDPEETAAQSRRAVVQVGARGWPALENDVLLATGADPAFTVASNVEPAESGDDEPDRSYLWWFAIGIAALLLVLVTQVVLTIRRDRQSRVRPAPRP